MGRSPCCDKVGLKKGPWTPEEDQKLLAHIEEHGHGSWRALPAKAGLQRCGKSCRLRWTNYLRPDIKRGKFSLQEEQTIIQLHALLGNRWSAIATHLPKRTDNEIKNYWNTHLKKRLAKMGIDPVTHKPKNDSLLSTNGQSKNAANLSHMAQWESARLEAEARLVRQSKLRSTSSSFNQLASPATKSAASPATAPARCLDILKAWNGMWPTEAGGRDLESPTSTVSFSENAPAAPTVRIGESNNTTSFFEFVGNSCEGGTMKEEGGEDDWKGFTNSIDQSDNHWNGTENEHVISGGGGGGGGGGSTTGNFMERFTDLLLNNSGDHRSLSEEDGGESDNSGGGGGDYYEDNKNYWNSILNLVNSSPSDSPMF